MTYLITALLNQNENVASYGAGNAATAIGASGSFDGQLYLQIGEASQGYRKNIWLWDDGAGAWLCVPCSPILGTGNPNGSEAPDAIGQVFKATDTGNTYPATGLTVNDWSLN